MQQREFRDAVAQFIANLAEDSKAFIRGFASSACRAIRIWEMTWAYDGRATFQYGEEVQQGQPHIVWRRIGTHSIFRRP
jgi:hypothetical protein